ncbi:MAG: tetratricopeptide repeat protein [Bacteroidetes bacterium]|nr:tetratricopeptide repeat protein [Bacteroidota bacterium]
MTAKQRRKTTTGGKSTKPGADERHVTAGVVDTVRGPASVNAMLAMITAFVLFRGVMVLADTEGLRLWGIDFGSYVSSELLLHGMLWLPLLFLLPGVAAVFMRIVESSRGKKEHSAESREGSRRLSDWRHLLTPAVLTLLAAVVAWNIQVGYAFLGDGTWYVAELYRSMMLPDYANSMIKPSAWLTGILLDEMAKMLRPDDIRLPFQLVGIAGMVVAAAAVFFSPVREAVSTRLAAFAFFLVSAGTLLFFGYIELYALVYGLSIAYLVTAWQCLRGNLPLWVPVLLLGLALPFGGIAVVWLPSLLLLLHWRRYGEGGMISLHHAAIILMLLPLIAVLFLYMVTGGSDDNAYLVALLPYERVVDGIRTGWQRYVLTAPERWADIGNMLLLGLGPLLFLMPVLLIRAAGQGLLKRPVVLFGLVAASGGFVFLLFGNTFLGLARDWDVGAFALLGMLALALILWAEMQAPLLRFRVMPVLLVALVTQCVLWCAVNLSEEDSAQRFEHIVEMDAGLILPMNSFTAWENLRKFHQSGGDESEYFRVLRRQIETGYRSHIGYAEYLSSTLKLRDARQRKAEIGRLLAAYGQVLSSAYPEDDFRHVPAQDKREFAARLLLSAWQIGERDLARRFKPDFRLHFSSWPEIGLLDVLRGEVAEGEEGRVIDAAVTDSTGDAFLHMSAGGLYQHLGEWERAAAAYEAALEREPSMYPSWYLVAAELHHTHTGDMEKARLLLERCIEHAPNSPEAARARELLLP